MRLGYRSLNTARYRKTETIKTTVQRTIVILSTGQHMSTTPPSTTLESELNGFDSKTNCTWYFNVLAHGPNKKNKKKRGFFH